MRRITLLLLFVGITGTAQIKGNKNIISAKVEASGINSIELQLYADVIVDQNLSEGITITADENLLPLINTEITSGRLILEQKEWIKPSQNIKIIIGAPNMQELLVDVHKTLIVKNINSGSISLSAPIGKIIAEGKSEKVKYSIKNGEIDASGLIATDGDLFISGSGKASINVSGTLKSELSEDARLVLAKKPLKVIGSTEVAETMASKPMDTGLRSIQLKIKNNSWNRTNFFVIGPNRDGSSFSYGFPLMPGASRNENWTVGTKVYKTNSIGKRTLLITVKEEDQGKTVKLFK